MNVMTWFENAKWNQADDWKSKEQNNNFDIDYAQTTLKQLGWGAVSDLT